MIWTHIAKTVQLILSPWPRDVSIVLAIEVTMVLPVSVILGSLLQLMVAVLLVGLDARFVTVLLVLLVPIGLPLTLMELLVPAPLIHFC